MDDAESSRRRRVALLIAAGAVILVGAAVLTLVDRGESTRDVQPIPTGAAPATLAAEACDHLTGEFPQQLADDAAADEVMAGVRRAQRLAQTAASRDPRWIALAGGAGALHESLEEDDPGGASVAIRVIAQSCAADELEPGG